MSIVESGSPSNSHKKVTSLKKNTSSMSSESSISENDSIGRTKKQTIIRQSTVEKRVVVTSKQETHKESSSFLTNGMESKEKATQKAPLPPKYGAPKDGVNRVPKPGPPVAKKTSYSQVATEDTTQSSKELVTTGVNIRSLKTSFNKAQDGIESFSSNPIEEVIPSVDRAQVARKFSQDPSHALRDDCASRGSEDGKSVCRICNKHVYQMEKITAEKSVFHKDCFKCKECGKKLTLDTYSSHEKEIYCKPHFKQLFQPKCQFGEDDLTPTEKIELDYEEGKQRANELVICENTPVDLPPDVVRCDIKSNDLESLSSLNLLNLKSRFELHQDEPLFPNTSVSSLQRSPSLMARMAKYQSAATGDHTNGDLSGGEDEADRDNTVVTFTGLKSQWESRLVKNPEESNLKEQLTKGGHRSCITPSGSKKAEYQKACQEAKQNLLQNETVQLSREVKTLSLKEKFEKGSVERDADIEAERQERIRREKQDELSCFGESATAEGARSLFRQMDAAATSGSPRSPLLPLSPMKCSSSVFQHQQGPVVVADVVKCSQPSEKEEIQFEPMQVSEKFRFFENYQEPQKERKRFQVTPPRDAVKEAAQEVMHSRDPNVIRSSDTPDDELPATDTAKKMLNKFKALESQAENPVPVPVCVKPAKRIPQPKEAEFRTVSPDMGRQQDPDIVRCSYKAEEDTGLVEVDTAKSLRAKFENWTTDVVRENLKNEKPVESGNGGVGGGGGGEEECLPQADMTRTLRAMFESIKESDSLKGSTEKAKPKVSKFIEQQQKMASIDVCTACDKRIYPVEKLEASGMKLHKNCFRCEHCNCVLRFENYTTSGGKLFCVTHFKQLFISKGNYDEGFGREQHKEKWNRSRSSTPTPREECSSSSSAFTEKTSEVAI